MFKKKRTEYLAVTTPHETQAQLPQGCKWCKPHCDDARCLGTSSVSLQHIKHIHGSMYMCIFIGILKLPRDCAVHRKSSETLTTCMIPHYPLSAVSQIPHCPLQCDFLVT